MDELDPVPAPCSLAAFTSVAPGRGEALPIEVVEVGVQRHVGGSGRRLGVVGPLPTYHDQQLAVAQILHVGGWLSVVFPRFSLKL